MRHQLPLLTVVTTLLLSCAAASTGAPPPRARHVPFPTVRDSSLDGKQTPVAPVLAGRAALVSMWATWCEACSTEFEALNRLAAHGKLVVGIAVGEERQTVAAFVATHGLHYAQLVDERFELSDALAERRVPATLVIDREGRIVFRGGVLDEQALAALRAAEERATP
jgi:cytochrome c biogenesis protein CcmG, thiol:disulfide interchange protein DsbE